MADSEKQFASIVLPKDYNPVEALVAVESLHGFIGRSDLITKTQSASLKHSERCRQVLANTRVSEMQVLVWFILSNTFIGCFFVIYIVAMPNLINCFIPIETSFKVVAVCFCTFSYIVRTYAGRHYPHPHSVGLVEGLMPLNSIIKNNNLIFPPPLGATVLKL